MNYSEEHKPGTAAESLFRAELGRIADKYQLANDRLHRSQTIKDCADAEQERREIAGQFWAAEDQLAQLTLLQVRIACTHQPEALRLWLNEVLRPDIEEVAKTDHAQDERIAALEKRIAALERRAHQ